MNYSGYIKKVNICKIKSMNNKEILNSVSDNLRMARLQQRISQERLAELAGISTKYLNMIENRKANPTIVIVIKICIILNMNLDIIYQIK